MEDNSKLIPKPITSITKLDEETAFYAVEIKSVIASTTCS